jgi:uncharacterized membrane protein
MTVKTLTRWLLPVSLAVNAFLAAITFTCFGPPWFRPPPPPNPAEMAARMAESLPPADAAVLRHSFAALTPPPSEGPAVFHARLRAALETPDFDETALRRVFADAAKAHAAFDDAMAAAIIDAAAKMSPEGRRQLAREGGHPPFGGPPPPPR